MDDFDRKLVGPRQFSEPKYEMIFVGGVGWIQHCKRTKQQVYIVGKKVRFIARDKEIQT